MECKCKPAKSYAERIIEYREFVELVKRMREAQKHRNDITTTFETLSQLEEADKRQDLLEKAIDKWLEENL